MLTNDHRLLVQPSLVKRSIYEFRYVDSEEKFGNIKEIKRMLINPIELGNRIEFVAKNGRTIYEIPIGKVLEISVVNENVGKWDTWIRTWIILLYSKNGRSYRIRLDFRDHHEEILNKLKSLISINIPSYFQKYSVGYKSQNKQIKNVEIYPMTPFLSPDEQLVWYNMKTSGIITKKVDWIQALTSFRVLEYDFNTHQCTCLPHSLIENAIANNRQSVSHTSQSGLFVGSGSSAAIIQGSGKSTSVTVGDITFTRSGKNYITFSQVQDPDGVEHIPLSGQLVAGDYLLLMDFTPFSA